MVEPARLKNMRVKRGSSYPSRGDNKTFWNLHLVGWGMLQGNRKKLKYGLFFSGQVLVDWPCTLLLFCIFPIEFHYAYSMSTCRYINCRVLCFCFYQVEPTPNLHQVFMFVSFNLCHSVQNSPEPRKKKTFKITIHEILVVYWGSSLS